jgi:hypothetical protein
VYKKSKVDNNSTVLNTRYTACIYDTCELIQKAYKRLIHASKYLTYLSSYILT